MAAEQEITNGLTEEEIVWGYRLFLDREPENDGVVAEKQRSIRSTQALRRALVSSDEYLANNPWAAGMGSMGIRRLLAVDVEVPAELQADLLAHTADTWRQLGVTDPYWSVLADEDYRLGSISTSLGAFEESGRDEVDGHMGLLNSNGVDISQLSSVLEYGCGVGRVTRWLAERFGTIYAYDVSAPHLKIARAMLKVRGCTNVFTHHLRAVPAPGELPRVDFVYCFLVLQHNSPPIIAQTLRRLLEAVTPGGVALLQIPTYRPGYRFDVDQYLESVVTSPSSGLTFEMHLLPQRAIHSIIAETGCETLEVLQDYAAGPDYVSNTFVVRGARP